jgi:hypothetical protein
MTNPIATVREIRHEARIDLTDAPKLTNVVGQTRRPLGLRLTYGLRADITRVDITIEIYDITVSAAGDIVIKAMDRETGESRSFRLDRLVSYTIHRTAYVIERPAADDKPVHSTYELAATVAPHAAHMTTATRINNLAAAFAA